MLCESGLNPGKPIPILMSVRELHHGGVERDVTKIAVHIDRSKFQPHVATYTPQGMRFDELQDANIPVLHLPVSSLKSFSTVTAALKLRNYIRTHGIRLIHAYDPSAVFVVPMARAMRVPGVLSSTLGYRKLYDKRTRSQLRWVDKMVDRVVVNCEAMRSHMINDEGMAGERVELCYNGFDPSQFYPATESLELRTIPEFRIGVVCVLRPEKALHLLQDAFSKVRHLKPHMKLLILGSGPELPRLEENARRLALGEDCVFLPSAPRVADFLRSLDIFVLSSVSEAFSNALLEAMACGCCSTASFIGGTPELLGNDERGLLFRPGDISDLAEKLARLIQDDSLRRRLANQAASFAHTKLNVSVASHRMAEIYERVLIRKLAA